ncbi:MAG: lipoyl(octanoyl) transferase LipB [Armatimonadetes bacterium]|nr:lipoyl(octanoyl) transferase LipB [Armatimonadota bacterium]
MTRQVGWLLDLTGGPVPYAEAWALQRTLLAARQAGRIPDVLVLLEHTPVVTIGRTGLGGNLLVSPDVLRAQGVDLFEIERGGDVTYHGPGQLVGYPIVDLRALDEEVVRFMRTLEESIIRTVAVFGISAARQRGYPGVWVAGAKIAAVGVAVKRRVTMHGFALNVNMDLSAFSVINPCGLGRPVTSMAEVLGGPVEMAHVRRVYAEQFSDVFRIAVHPTSRETFEGALREVPATAEDATPPQAVPAEGVSVVPR